jgi:hypothetical protein
VTGRGLKTVVVGSNDWRVAKSTIGTGVTITRGKTLDSAVMTTRAEKYY